MNILVSIVTVGNSLPNLYMLLSLTMFISLCFAYWILINVWGNKIYLKSKIYLVYGTKFRTTAQNLKKKKIRASYEFKGVCFIFVINFFLQNYWWDFKLTYFFQKFYYTLSLATIWLWKCSVATKKRGIKIYQECAVYVTKSIEPHHPNSEKKSLSKFRLSIVWIFVLKKKLNNFCMAENKQTSSSVWLRMTKKELSLHVI